MEELYIKPLNINLQELADNLDISRNILCRIRTAKARITPCIAVRLAEAFNTSPDVWLNLQQKYDIWIEENEKSHKPVKLMYRTPLARTRIRRMPKVASS